MRAWTVLVALAGCQYQDRDPGGAGTADGASEDGPGASDAAPDAVVLGPFGAPTPIALPGGEAGDDDPSLTGDELELYFNATRGAPSADIWVATRTTTEEGWALPRLVAELSSEFNETTPEVSTDGLTIYIASDRPGGAGGNDIYVSTRQARRDPWGPPARVAGLSSPAAEASPGTADGLAVAFTTDGGGGTDIVSAERATTTDVWSPWTPQDAINSSGHDGSPWLMADHVTLYFDSDRAGVNHLYQTRRDAPGGPFPAPTPVPGLEDPTFGDQDPWVSPDGRHIVFWSDRGGTGGLWEARR